MQKQLIPKHAFFFWGNKTMSWLRYKSIESFCKLHPDWRITLYFHYCKNNKKVWTNHNLQDFFYFKGKNYFEKVKKIPNLIFRYWDLPEEEKPSYWYNISASQKSNLFKWYMLWKQGGFYLDTDIVFIKSINPFYEKVKNYNTLICDMDWLSIGLLGSIKNNQFYRDIFNYAIRNFISSEYQSAGVISIYNLLYQKILNINHITKIKNKYPNLSIYNIPKNLIYYYTYREMDKIFFQNNKLPEESIGLHWYAGNPIAQDINNSLNEEIYKYYECTLTNLLKKDFLNPQNFKVISFYTKNSPYQIEIERLRTSLNNLGLNYQFYEKEDQGKWVINAGLKAQVILKALIDYPDKNILYVDADAIIHQYPNLFDDFNGDIGIHYRKGIELLSGTIFLRNSSKIRNFIYKWVLKQKENKNIWDQQILQNLLEKEKNLNIVNLPSTYTQIFDLMKDAGKPVIEHFQASRRFKSSINKKEKIMESLNNMRPRYLDDGSFWLPRIDRQFEQKLKDQGYIKWPNENRWYPPIKKEGKDWVEMEKFLNGKIVYIIGKGPSLDKIAKRDFLYSDRPIICINESIHMIEKLGLSNQIFAIQQDDRLGNTCQPKYGLLIISKQAKDNYKDFENKFVYVPQQFNCMSSSLTVEVAINICKEFGAKEIRFLGFDACTNKDCRYAKIIGYKSTKYGDSKRFLEHKNRINSLLFKLNLKVKWLQPRKDHFQPRF